MSERGPESIPGLASDTLRQARQLLLREFDLVRMAAGSSAGHAATGLVMVIVAGVFLLAALFVLSAAAVIALEQFAGWSLIAAIAAVGGGYALIGLVLLWLGMRSFRAARMGPASAARSLRRTAELLGGSGDDA